jgi:hypothetical protein
MWLHPFSAVFWIASALAIASAVVWRLTRCRHPNPHYVRPVSQLNELTGQSVVIEPARYVCYECGRSWPARQRDPAWTSSHLVRTFSGYDPNKAIAAATRAAIEEEQRRFLAVNRGVPRQRDAANTPFRPATRRKRLSTTKVVDLKSRKPA